MNFNEYVVEANKFLQGVAENLGKPNDLENAYRAMVLALRNLRDNTTPEEFLEVIEPLPTIIKGIAVDGWVLSKEVKKIYQQQDVLDAIKEHNFRPVTRGLW